jgi:hypothetical protein
VAKFRQTAKPESIFYKYILSCKVYMFNVNLMLRRNLNFFFLNSFNFNSAGFNKNINNIANNFFFSNGTFNHFTDDANNNNIFKNSLIPLLYNVTQHLSNIKLYTTVGLPLCSYTAFNHGIPKPVSNHRGLLDFDCDISLFFSADIFYHFNSFSNLKFVRNHLLTYNNKQLNTRNNAFILSSFFTSNSYNTNFLKMLHINFLKTNFFNFYSTNVTTHTLCFNNILIKKYKNTECSFLGTTKQTNFVCDYNFCSADRQKFFFYINTCTLFYGCKRGLHENFFLSKTNLVQLEEFNKNFANLYV